MKLRKIYCNIPDIFGPVVFNDGLSLVIAEIRLPENQDKVTHNLGKTTLGQLVDFCLLKKRHPKFFLFKHEDQFSDFIFYLEIEADSGEYITIARSVRMASKIGFLRTAAPLDDATEISPDDWDHTGLAFERAKALLDAWLGLTALKPWDYRKMIGYLLREQDDYSDVFQLGKFAGKHSDWKPFVAHILGLDAGIVADLYQVRDQLDESNSRLQTLVREWGTADTDTTELDALISLRENELTRRQAAQDALDFAESDAEVSEELVEDIEFRIASHNEERYLLQREVERISRSLEEESILFRPSEAERIFREAGVVFGDQIRRTYEQLIEFNRQISSERSSALRRELTLSKDRIETIDRGLSELNETRASSLSYLRETETMQKFRSLSQEISTLEGQLGVLQEKRKSAARLTTLRQDVREHEQSANALQTKVERNIAASSTSKKSTFSVVRGYFSEIIHEVLHEDAILGARFNDSGGLDFYAEFLDAKGMATSADRGTTYRKLMCIAFDLAILRAHINVPFPRFVYHDGAFEALERRPKENLLRVLRSYANLGLQPIVTALAGDLPSDGPIDGEVVSMLHDEGPSGRLFRFESW
ncbi:DUF2326 domain-containing protein [Arthrobacter sp. U41]|uniref:DUF2326 domain-containing protein n=1 Tax=Arthrobacter sp. U41 TaxID=1849032 RepID=UPI000859459F|nr:DUF2326 domain-containing protein [Arthrobacter sp. U41]AOT05987.1 hypothetical protein ASPU41_21390 [Arthrobacter sp. U41]